ncbi:MAG: hypothetical protein US25_C0082G0007 [Candidatus Moranbacteria bacterium GW2011_GWE1_36_7]|nr:MAG: hypothetical protein UR99_C0069G0001 [Candidatus Moranbacteria bacterium GW2011_GWD2_36_12]KKQ04458.1 MAG: hypothetical protein US16_C0059G0007 [Candidatus Moranbacteria bacterium GW2011_GWE2_36_40]KKQ11508.1 MAG: hypothetical protein US25_C0082G0007 [Candidatus Moranbacteria bacterium GW2011_GWE1_36_7]
MHFKNIDNKLFHARLASTRLDSNESKRASDHLRKSRQVEQLQKMNEHKIFQDLYTYYPQFTSSDYLLYLKQILFT